MAGSVLAPPSAARDDTDSPVDWEFAERVALRTSGSTGYARSRVSLTMPAEFRTLTATAQDLVEDFTRLRSAAGPAHAEVIDRAGWIRANIAGFRHLLDPLVEKLTAAVDPESHASDKETTPDGSSGPTWSSGLSALTKGFGRRAVGAELGLMLGFLSQRVLGQFDLLLPEEAAGGAEGGVVYYVGPNIADLEARYGFRTRDFRLWIALHEVAHRTQFTGVEWLRPYFLSLVDRGMGGIDPDPGRLFDVAGEIFDRVRSGKPAVGEDGLVSLFATPEQRESLASMQSLMTLLEGHGNFVMDTLGAEHVEGQGYMSRTLSARRSRGGLSKILLRLLGMEMKARQYEEGQRFINQITELGGPTTIDAAWQSEETVPTLDEIRNDPAAWLTRVGAGARTA